MPSKIIYYKITFLVNMYLDSASSWCANGHFDLYIGKIEVDLIMNDKLVWKKCVYIRSITKIILKLIVLFKHLNAIS